ncbi:MAG: hypothetical protein ABR953_11385 [Candidatus Acidiferrales bacterium]|jgi:hypothetical protein
MEAIIKFVSDKGWFLAEDLSDSSGVYIHQKSVEKRRYLKIGDIVSYESAPSNTRPGETMAINVKFLGRAPIARQISTEQKAKEEIPDDLGNRRTEVGQ